MTDSPASRHSLFTLFIRSLAILFSLCLIGVACLPTILSSSWARAQLLTQVNQNISGHIDVDGLSVSWFGPQSVEHVSLKSAQGTKILSLEKASIDSSLGSLLWHPAQFNTLELTALNASIILDENGTTNIEKAFSKTTAEPHQAISTIVIKNFQVDAHASSSQTPATLNISGTTQQGSVVGKIAVQAELNSAAFEQIVAKQGENVAELLKSSDALKVDVDITNFPVALIDQLIAQKIPNAAGLVVEALGPALNLSVKQSNAGRPLVDVKLTTQFLNIPEFEILIGNEISLRNPMTVTWQPSDSSLKKFPLLNSSKPIVKLNVRAFKIPSTGKMTIDASLTTSSLAIPDSINLSNVELKLLASPELPLNFDARATLTQTDSAGLLNNALGEKIAITAQGKVLLDEGSIDNFNFQILSDIAQMKLTGKITSSNELKILAPATISYKITPKALKYFGVDASEYLIQNPKPLLLTIAPSDIPLNSDAIKQLRLSGTFKVTDLSFAKKTREQETSVTLDSLTAEWEADAAKSLIAMRFLADTRLAHEAAGKINGSLDVANWLQDTSTGATIDFSKAILYASLTTNKLPVEMISIATGNQDLLALLGDSLDLTTVIQYSPSNEAGSLLIDIGSKYLKGSINLGLGKTLHLKDAEFPGEFTYELTPAGYSVLRQRFIQDSQSDFTLSEPATVAFKIKSLKLPAESLQHGSLAYLDAGFDLSLNLEHLSGSSAKKSQKIFLKTLKGTISSKKLSQLVTFDLLAKGQTGQGISSELNMKGAMEQGFNSQGGLNFDGMNLNFDTAAETFPVALLCQLLCSDPKLLLQLDAIIGTTLNAKVTAKLHQSNGWLVIDLNGKNGKLLIDSTIRNGMVFLNKDLTAQITVTPELSKYVLDDLFPITEGMINADSPLKLTIDQKGFAFPLKQTPIESISIGSAALELGKVRFSSQSELAKIFSLLGNSSKDQIMVWLTPLYFSIKQGVVKMERLDMLVNNSFPIAAWGKVDIINDSVNAVIALSGASINKAFKVQGIPNSYFLQIPLRGTISNADIDKTKAAARLSALIAQSQGGTHGAVIGTVLHIASGGLTEGSVPKATARPLPWAEMLEDSASDQEASDSKSTNANTTDALKKEAGNLMKKLFK